MAEASNEIEMLQVEMHQVRMSLGEDAHELVAHARTLADWRVYWRNNPWAWCGTAAVLGYCLVPQRTHGKTDVRHVAEQLADGVKAALPPPGRGIVSQLAGMALGAVMQRGLQIIGREVGAMFTSPAPCGDAAQPNDAGEEASIGNVSHDRKQPY
jgi:hypothetical protein